MARTPLQEAQLALDLVARGSYKDALPLARSAYERESRPGLGLLALGTTLDAFGQSYEAIEYLRKYVDNSIGQNDWRGYARLGNICMRSRNYRMARRYLEQAERLTPATVGRARILVVIDYAEALANCEGQEKGRAVTESLIRSVPDARNEPQFWLLTARIMFMNPDTNLAATDAAVQSALDAVARRQRGLRTDDVVAVHELQDALRFAREAREHELDLLDKIEKNPEKLRISAGSLKRPALLSRLAATIAQEAEMIRRSRLLTALEVARKAVAFDEHDPEPNVALAGILLQLDDRPSAETILRQILIEKPSFAPAQEMLKSLSPPPPSSAPAKNETRTPASVPQPAASQPP